jgi:probable rRNA maturation factor
MNKYDIIDEYGYRYPKVLDLVLQKLLDTQKITDSIFTIIFVDNKKIHDINLKYRGIDRPTDVISFAYEDNQSQPILDIRVLGEIFVSIDKMQEQAKEYGHSETREICFLCVHGLLHLLGYDHQTPEEEKEMFTIQEAILNEFEETKRN